MKPTDARNAKEFLPGKVKNKSVFPWQQGWDVGYAEAIDAYNNVLIEGDVEALAKALWDFVSEYHETDKRLPQLADEFISTMPTWLKPTERK